MRALRAMPACLFGTLMTIEERQLNELVDLALSCRPHGAPSWDGSGVKLALRKVQHMELAEVMHAVVEAASDRTLKTPGLIGDTTSGVWRRAVEPPPPPEPPPRQQTTVAQRVTAGHGSLCSVCSLHEQRCRELWADDHEYLSNDELAAIVAKQDPLERSYRIDELRKLIGSFGKMPDDDEPAAASRLDSVMIRDANAAPGDTYVPDAPGADHFPRCKRHGRFVDECRDCWREMPDQPPLPSAFES